MQWRLPLCSCHADITICKRHLGCSHSQIASLPQDWLSCTQNTWAGQEGQLLLLDMLLLEAECLQSDPQAVGYASIDLCCSRVLA